MVLRIVEVATAAFLPTQYLTHLLIAVVSLLVVRTVAQGRKTNRERDLHARTILVTGGFTPLGLTVIQELAQRGARIIALSNSPADEIIVPILRTATSNENIFTEECDLHSPSAVRQFCTRFVAGEGDEKRLDGIVFAHEYRHLGSWGLLSRFRLGDGNKRREEEQKLRESSSLTTFLMTTLLLPLLLVAPAERDIRIVNVVNPFYAAATGNSFSLPSLTTFSLVPFQHTRHPRESIRSLRTILVTRHLQRILDALPAPPLPQTSDTSTAPIPVVPGRLQKSNIVAMSVSPGFSRQDTIAPLLLAEWGIVGGQWSSIGIILYLILQPLLRVLAKSPISAVQSILHVLFLPTPFKILSQNVQRASMSATSAPTPKTESVGPIDAPSETREEVLKPGALYGECAVVNLRIPILKDEGGEEDVTQTPAPETLSDDGEYGGEYVGRMVWEAYEAAVKAWEAAEPPRPAPPVDVSESKGEPKGKERDTPIDESKIYN